MQLLKEFNEKDVGIERAKQAEVNYKLRKAARAVLFDKEGRIALMAVTKRGYHKLPGGGVEKGEDLSLALKREVQEETGCDLKVRPGDVGLTIEYRDERGLLQLSYCFLADVVGVPGEVALTEKEAADGFQLIWVGLGEAIKLMEKDRPDDYVAKFIRMRDMVFLKKASELHG